MLNTGSRNKTRGLTRSPVKVYNRAVLALAEIAECSVNDVAGVLGVSQPATSIRLRGRTSIASWRALRRRFMARELRATRLRWFWRTRLRDVGVDPATLSPLDPLWRACWRWPRGFWVRVAAHELRRERPDLVLATIEGIDAVIERATALRTAFEDGVGPLAKHAAAYVERVDAIPVNR